MKSHVFDTRRKAPNSTARWICLTCVYLFFIQGCMTSTTASTLVGGSETAAAGNQNKVVPVEVSARIEGLGPLTQGTGENAAETNANGGGSEVRFRESGEVGPNRSLRISQLPSDSQQAISSTKAGREDYQMEVKAVALNTDNVILEIDVFSYDKTGKRVSLSKPRLVVQYGDAAEIQELNAAPDAAFSRLSLSVLPGKPRLSNSAATETTSQNADQKSGSGAAK